MLDAVILFFVSWVGFLTLFTEIAKSDRDVKSGRIKLKEYWTTDQGRTAILFSIVLAGFVTGSYNLIIYLKEVL